MELLAILNGLPKLTEIVRSSRNNRNEAAKRRLGYELYLVYEEFSNVVSVGREIVQAFKDLLSNHINQNSSTQEAMTVPETSNLSNKVKYLIQLVGKQEANLDRSYDQLNALKREIQIVGGSFYHKGEPLRGQKALWLARAKLGLETEVLQQLSSDQRLSHKQQKFIEGYLASSGPSQRLNEIDILLAEYHSALTQTFSMAEIAVMEEKANQDRR